MLRIKKRYTFLSVFAAACFLLLVPFAPSAQEGAGPPQLKTKHHELLARDAGVWNADCTVHGPQGKMEFSGTETVSVDCDGLWMISDFEGEFMGMPFKGHSISGYDPEKKKVVGVWVDSMNTRISTLEGTVDGESIVMHTEGVDPMTGEKYPERHVQTREGDDKRVLKMYAERDGGEHLMMEVVYERVK